MFGIGLRPKHYRAFLEDSPRVDFVEAIAENFMGIGGRPLAVLEQARRDRPVFLHGVSLGLASADELDARYLSAWKALITRVQPAVVSDHLCWGRAHGRYSHDLLPLAFTDETLAHTVTRVQQVQDVLGRQLALENVSSYLQWQHDEWTEWDFLAQLVKRSGCAVLLDVNNVFVSAQNHGFSALDYFDAIPREAVVQFHLAGHQRRPDVIIDTHDGPVSNEVWSLYGEAVARFGRGVPTLIEWDDQVPELEVLLAEARRAAHIPIPTARTPGTPSVQRERRPSLPLENAQRIVFTAICDSTPVAEEAAALIAESGTLTPTARLELYADMYWLRMRDTLRDAFSRVLERVGIELFDGLVADFLRVHPSTHFSLDRLGAPFAAFLADAKPELTDLAALEWARTEAFVALDAPTEEFTALTALPPDAWGDVTLAAHPSVRVVKPSVVVWRKGFQVFDAPVSEHERDALSLLLRSTPLPEVLLPFETLGEQASEAALTALSSWFHEGMISRVDSPANRERAH